MANVRSHFAFIALPQRAGSFDSKFPSNAVRFGDLTAQAIDYYWASQLAVTPLPGRFEVIVNYDAQIIGGGL